MWNNVHAHVRCSLSASRQGPDHSARVYFEVMMAGSTLSLTYTYCAHISQTIMNVCWEHEKIDQKPEHWPYKLIISSPRGCVYVCVCVCVCAEFSSSAWRSENWFRTVIININLYKSSDCNSHFRSYCGFKFRCKNMSSTVLCLYVCAGCIFHCCVSISGPGGHVCSWRLTARSS